MLNIARLEDDGKHTGTYDMKHKIREHYLALKYRLGRWLLKNSNLCSTVEDADYSLTCPHCKCFVLIVKKYESGVLQTTK